MEREWVDLILISEAKTGTERKIKIRELKLADMQKSHPVLYHALTGNTIILIRILLFMYKIFPFLFILLIYKLEYTEKGFLHGPRITITTTLANSLFVEG